MLSPSEWPTTFGDTIHQSLFSHRGKDMEEVDATAQTLKRFEQDKKQNHWELELEKIKQQFMNSTPFKKTLTGSHMSTYDGNIGRQELQQAKTKALSDISHANFRKDTKDNLFKVEYDVYEFDPETVKVRLEDDTLVVEARQLIQDGASYRSKKEFYRKVGVPTGANSNRMMCRLSTTGILTIEIPAPPSYSEAFKDSKQNTGRTTGYPPSTTENTLSNREYSPSTSRYTQSTTRYTPNQGTYVGYPPTKYSTLPSYPKQKYNKIYIGRSHSSTCDPKWRARQQKISLSDSLDSETTLSSSPSDDLYNGHSSFSDLDM